MFASFIASPAGLGRKPSQLRSCRVLRQAIRYTPLATTARSNVSTNRDDDSAQAKLLPNESRPTSPAFSWTEQWFAIALEVDVPAGKPYPFMLFDTPLVLFRSSANEFSVLEDRCSHRLAPLSEGRVVQKGNCAEIECPYHGWQFNATGACTLVPQNDAGSRPPRAAAVRSYPSAEVLGAVWVWAGVPENADPANIPMHRLGLTDKVQLVSLTRIIPIKYETLVENLLDYNHVFFAHHGASGWKRTDSRIGVGGDLKEVIDDSPQGSFDVDWADVLVRSRPPTTIAIYSNMASALNTEVAAFACSPSGHRNSRLIVWLLADRRNRKMRTIFSILPRWAVHAQSNVITDGDIVLLREVERQLGKDSEWKDKYGPPAGKGDQAVNAFRKFMDLHRDEMPWRQPPPALEAEETLGRAEIMDRLHTHTQQCTACSGALIGWRRVKAVAYAGALTSVALLLGLAAIAAAAQPGVINTRIVWKLAVVDVVLLCTLMAAWKLASRYEEEFTYTEKYRRLYES